MANNNKVALATGGFDPCHGGHINYLREAQFLGSLLIVGLNSDKWLERKKGRAFMPFNERRAIIESFEFVHRVIEFNDDDDTANDAITKTLELYGNDIIFCNGGDRTLDNTLEQDEYGDNERVTFEYNVGGGKTNSSSVLLNQWEHNVTMDDWVARQWGKYRVLRYIPGTKVKELVVNPGASLSMQRHEHRSEHWFVGYGEAKVEYQRGPHVDVGTKYYKQHDILTIPVNCWHRLSNITDQVLGIVEIQYGTSCEEYDIERKDHK